MLRVVVAQLERTVAKLACRSRLRFGEYHNSRVNSSGSAAPRESSLASWSALGPRGLLPIPQSQTSGVAQRGSQVTATSVFWLSARCCSLPQCVRQFARPAFDARSPSEAKLEFEARQQTCFDATVRASTELRQFPQFFVNPSRSLGVVPKGSGWEPSSCIG